MRQLLERRAANPVVIPVQREIDGRNVADQPGGNRLAHPGEVRRPAAVLVHGEPQAELLRERRQPFALGERERERLLRKHMLPRAQSRLDDRPAHFRRGRDVRHAHVLPREQLPPIRENCCVREKLRAPRLRPLAGTRGQRDHAVAGLPISLQMALRDSPQPIRPMPTPGSRGTRGRYGKSGAAIDRAVFSKLTP